MNDNLSPVSLGSLNTFQQNLQKHLQEQLLKEQQQQQQRTREEVASGGGQQRVINGHVVGVQARKPLSQSISEEGCSEEPEEAATEQPKRQHCHSAVSHAMKIDFNNPSRMAPLARHKVGVRPWQSACQLSLSQQSVICSYLGTLSN
jgi:hypothetical protein